VKPRAKYRVAVPATAKRKTLFFSDCHCKNWSVFHQVFSFEVRADPFADFSALRLADLSAGVGQEINLLKAISFRGKDLLHLLEVIGVVGGDADSTRGFQASDKLVAIGGAEEASFVVAFFGPGVGEVNVEAIDGGVGDALGNIGDGIGANYPDVSQIPSPNPVNGKTVKFACPFNPDKIGVGLVFCLVYQKCPLA
jgi:hypothetical protein